MWGPLPKAQEASQKRGQDDNKSQRLQKTAAQLFSVLDMDLHSNSQHCFFRSGGGI